MANLINNCLSIWSKVTYALDLNPKTFEIPNGYFLKHYDNFANLDFSFWHIGHEWGDHPVDNPIYYWNDKDNNDEDVVRCINNELRLDAIRKPKMFGKTEIPFKVGLIESNVGFLHGIFKCRAMIPKGGNLWPAFWMWGMEKWPPEVDIMEGYTSQSKLQPNVHYRMNGEHRMLGPTDAMVRNWDTEFHEYTLWWESDFIKIYYDGRLVFSVTDKDFLNRHYNNASDAMRIVFNNSISPDIDRNTETPCVRPFIIKEFEIFQKI